ncbi:hypothetical protein [Clostridium sp. UBA6640]|jgi:translation initiation factor IF-1|uniref:hypothetical protein n=1 Tax=Clostridium sp. UBA6640 TaxID=1946370 RepID=UPI0025BB3138|nr:hypothetical protein [Clostridium sp. UBA6640]
MFGKVIDMNSADAFVELTDGITINVAVSKLPNHIKVGDKVAISFSNSSTMLNNKIADFL